MVCHKITINDIAKEAHVSTATVSNFINHKDNLMSKTTYGRVKRIILKYHYVPSVNARQLKNNKPQIVAFFADDITNGFSIEMFKGALYELKKFGYNTLLLNSNRNCKEEKANLLSLDTNLLAGIIIQPVSDDLKSFEDESFSEIPIVVLDKEIPNSQYCSIVTNNFYIVRKVCRYFKHNEKIDKVILISNNNQHSSTVRQRMLGISHIYAERDVKLINPGSSKTSTQIAYRQLKKEVKNNPNSLIFVLEEYMLLDFTSRLIYDGIIGRGKKTLITGFSDNKLINKIDPKIKVIKQYPFKMGSAAGKILINKLNKKETNKSNRIVIPASFDY